MSAYLRTVCDNLYRNPVFTGDFGSCADQGEASSDQGVSREDNPYPEGTGEHDSWDYGWGNSLRNLCGGIE